MPHLALSLIVSSVFLFGCKPDKPDIHNARRAKGLEHAASATEVAKKRADNAVLKKAQDQGVEGKVLARMGDVTITIGDLLRQIASQPAYKQQRYTTKPGRRALLNEMLIFEVLAKEAERRGMGRTSRVQFAWKNAMVKTYLKQLYSDELKADRVTAEAVKAYYEKHATDYKTPETRRAALIVVLGRKAVEDVRLKLEAAVKATPVATRQVFGDFAKKFSVHEKSKLLKGDLGWFDRDANPEKRRERPSNIAVKEAFKLQKINQISKPFRAEGGWALLQLTGIRPAKVKPLEEVSVAIRQKLLEAEKTTLRKATVARLMKGAKIEIDEKAFNQVKGPKIERKKAQPQAPKASKIQKKKRSHPGLVGRGNATKPRLRMDRVIRPGIQTRHSLNAKEVVDKMRGKSKKGSK